MPRFASYDGTEIAYRVLGDGPPLVCLPGGPGRAAEYLGDLGGLDKVRQLILPDSRGVGASADPVDPVTFRVDRLVEDVESLRAHLGLERMDLLAHSAGAILATLYAAAYPGRVSRLLLITPGLWAVDVDGTEEEFTALIERHATRPWYPAARAALEKIESGDRTIPAFLASRPFFYGRWDEAAQAHAGLGVVERHFPARNGFFDGVEVDVTGVKAGLAKLTAPVLLYAGDQDPQVTPAMVSEAAPAFNDAAVTVQPGAGHFPWIDDATAFAAAVEAFLG
jgi:pimeloyl-ACP methyl ester carboxylesterase